MKLSNVINIIMVVSVIVAVLSWAYVLFCPFPLNKSQSQIPSTIVKYKGVVLFSDVSYGNVVFVYDPNTSKIKIIAHTSGGEYFKGIARDKEGNPAFRCPKTIDGGTEFGDTIAKYNTKELQWECDVKFAPVSLEG